LVNARFQCLPEQLARRAGFLASGVGRTLQEEAFDEDGELREHTAVLLNGMHYRHLPDGLNSLLKDGDQIAIFPPIAGG